jgi:peptidyl-prolyl cis-trans isomerase A (cyclophilin A)
MFTRSLLTRRARAAFAAAALLAAPLLTLAQNVRLETTEGTIVIELDAERAPKTVANFVQYVRAKFYDGTIFHRTIGNFMIQGGGYLPDLSSRPTRGPIPLESRNGLNNVRGSIAMARTAVPDSATSQFFINHKDNPGLDAENARDGHGYAVFGRVVDGLDVVDRIAALPTKAQGQFQNLPQTPVLIKRATLEK